MNIKRLFWDIETSPNIVLSWRVGYKLNIDQANIVKERAIICIGYKWESDKKARLLTWDKNQCDKEMIARFLKIASKSDELIAHNGDQFDLPWFKTRCLFHGHYNLPNFKTADTLQWAKRRFLFNSNKMDYIARYLGIGEKIKTHFDLWKKIVLEKDKKSLKYMGEYCRKDVEILEKVWKVLSASSPIKTHVGVLSGGMKWSCPKCSSERVKVQMTKITAAGTPQKQMHCLTCGRFYTISQTSFEAYKEAKHKKC